MTPTDERLFGTPGAEELHFDLASAYETQIEPYHDEHDRRPAEIEEWTVSEPTKHLPRLDWVIEYLIETIADDMTEGAYDAWQGAIDTEVKVALQDALNLWASKVTYRMADKLVRTWTITWDGDVPLADGEPIYRKDPS